MYVDNILVKNYSTTVLDSELIANQSEMSQYPSYLEKNVAQLYMLLIINKKHSHICESKEIYKSYLRRFYNKLFDYVKATNNPLPPSYKANYRKTSKLLCLLLIMAKCFSTKIISNLRTP